MKLQTPKRVVIVHGWRGRPDKGWLKWLATELEKLGIEVLAPQLSDRYDPKPVVWVAELAKLIGPLGGNTIFVGHSMGCPIILRYLSEYDAKEKGLISHLVGGIVKPKLAVTIPAAIFVAGFYELSSPKFDNYFGRKPDFDKLKRMIKKSYCIYSDNDKIVDPARSKNLAERMRAKEVMISGKAHFGNVIQPTLPEVLFLIKKTFELN